MSTLPVSEAPESPENLPFVVPCRTLDMAAPLRWLRLGWADLRRAPLLSLSYGFALILLSVLIALFTWRCISVWQPVSCLSARCWRWGCIRSAASWASACSP